MAKNSEDATLNLSEAKKLTGLSDTKFKTPKNQEALIAAGAVLEGTGKSWQIPTSALISLGWLNEDGTQKPVTRRPRGARSGKASNDSGAHPLATSNDLGAIATARDEAVSLEAELNEQLTAAREALKEANRAQREAAREEERISDAWRSKSAEAKLLTKRFDDVRTTALEEAEKDARESAERLARTRKALGLDA